MYFFPNGFTYNINRINILMHFIKSCDSLCSTVIQLVLPIKSSECYLKKTRLTWF